MYQKKKRIISLVLLAIMVFTMIGGVLTPGQTSQAAGTIKHVVGLLNVGDTTIVKGTTTPPSSYGNTDTAILSLSGSQQYIVGAFVLSNSKIDHYEILLKKGNTIFKYSPTETKNHAGLTTAIVNAYNKQDKTTYQTVNTEWNYIIDTNNLDAGQWTLESWAYTAAGTFCAGKVTINVGVKNISTYNHASCYEGAIKTGNAYNTVNKSDSYKTTAKFKFRLWAIHDQGLSGYSYKITSSNGGSYSSGSVSLNSIVRYDLDEYKVRETLKIGQSASLANTGCDGTVDFSKFKPGSYKIEITATPKKGNAFKVLQINLKIDGKTVTFVGGTGAKYISGSSSLPLTTVTGTTNLTYATGLGRTTLNYNVLPKFSRAGYEFMGYAESSNSTTAKYKPNTDFCFDQNKTLYAVWKKEGSIIPTPTPIPSDQLIIEYDPNGGEITDHPEREIQVVTGDPVTLNPPTMERYGHKFVGYTLDQQITTVNKTGNIEIRIESKFGENDPHTHLNETLATQKDHKIYHAGDQVAVSELKKSKSETKIILYAVWQINADFQRDVYSGNNIDGEIPFTVTDPSKYFGFNMSQTVKDTKAKLLTNSDKEKVKQFAEAFSHAILDELGYKDNYPKIELSPKVPQGTDHTLASYDHSQDIIYIYPAAFESKSSNMAQLVAHETRHAYQYRMSQEPKSLNNAADKVKYIYEYNQQSSMYGDINNHYVSGDGFNENQYNEAEAYCFMNLFK